MHPPIAFSTPLALLTLAGRSASGLSGTVAVRHGAVGLHARGRDQPRHAHGQRSFPSTRTPQHHQLTESGPEQHAYSHLPTSEAAGPVTVKSDGQERFCKKCQFRKPDRTHHCSSCRTCVLKMDHHCPWLVNCLGLRNYKAFLLFLIYTSLFCIVCFFVSVHLVFDQVFSSGAGGGGAARSADDLTPVNWVLLAVVAGIVGLVLSGFTFWHLMLTGRNMTTIESLEKVRYTAPSSAPPPGARLVGRPSFPHETARYGNYLLDESTRKLPHAFDLGRARNFAHVFGGRDKMHLWLLPVFSGDGDGWHWETSRRWLDAAAAVRQERDKFLRDQAERERAAGWGDGDVGGEVGVGVGVGADADAGGVGVGVAAGRGSGGRWGYDPLEEEAWRSRPHPPGLIRLAGGSRDSSCGSGNGTRSKADRLLGRAPGAYSDEEGLPLQKMAKKSLSADALVSGGGGGGGGGDGDGGDGGGGGGSELDDGDGGVGDSEDGRDEYQDEDEDEDESEDATTESKLLRGGPKKKSLRSSEWNLWRE